MPSSGARRTARVAATRAFQGLDGLRAERQKYAFVLAHMRSGSTLLTHILLANPAIAGIGERDATYASSRDLHLLGARGYWAGRWPPRRFRFVLDQVNHDRYLPDERLLADPRLWSIVLAREPEPSIASMVHTFGDSWGWDVDAAVEYYRARLRTLIRYADIPDARVIVVTYSQLVDAADPALRRIEGFLGLSSRLHTSYPTHAFTGIAGDRSGVVAEGAITEPRRLAPVSIPAPTLDGLQELYGSLASRAVG